MLKRTFAFAILLGLLFVGCSGQDQLAAAKKLLEEQKFQEAESLYLKATEANAENAAAWNGLGLAQMQQEGKAEVAMQSLGKAIEIEKAGKADKAALGKYYFDRGFLRYSLIQFESAIPDFDGAIENGYELSDAYAYKGVSIANIGDDITALQVLKKSVETDDQNHFAWSNLGYINSKVGDNKTAIFNLSKAIEIQPDDKVSYLNRGYTYIGMGDYITALKDIDKALELDPDYLGAVAYKGIALTNIGKPAEALPFLNRAVEMQPENPAFFYYRGVTRIALQDLEGGCLDLQHAANNGNYEGEAMRKEVCGE